MAGLGVGLRRRRLLTPGPVPAGGGAAWTPASLPGLQFWHDIYNVGGAADGAQLATWADRSANAYNLTQATADDQPYYVANDCGSGKAAVVLPFAVRAVTKTCNMAWPVGLAFNTRAASLFTVVRWQYNNQEQVFLDFGDKIGFDRKVTTDLTKMFFAAAAGAILTPCSWTVLGATSNAAGVNLYANSRTAAQAAGADANTTGGALGHYIGTSGFHFMGAVRALIGYSRVLTDAERTALMSWMANTYGSPLARTKRVVFDGNSFFYGNFTANGQIIPQSVMASLGGEWEMLNHGVGGQTTTQMTTDGVAQIDPLIDATLDANVLVATEITNDIVGGSDGATAYNNMVAYLTARKAAGWTVIFTTCLPRNRADPFEANRAACNTALRADFNVATANALVKGPKAGVTYADLMVDWALDTRLDDYTDTTYYWTDGVHPAMADGVAACAQDLAAAINLL